MRRGLAQVPCARDTVVMQAQKLSTVAMFVLSCSSTISCTTSDGSGAATVTTYVTSTSLLQDGAKANSVGTPTSVTGEIMLMEFRSDNAIDDSHYAEPSAHWFLLETESPAYFDLSERYEISQEAVVSEDVKAGPSTIGLGVYQSIHFEFFYLDIDFRLDDEAFSLRICMSSRQGYKMGDLLLKDTDGTYKWISKSGDPDELLSTRPSDPVQAPAGDEGWEPWEEEFGPNWLSPAHIPEEYYFDVPSLAGVYEVTLDFQMADTAVVNGYDPESYTKRDILENFAVQNYLGGGTLDNILKVVPTVTHTPAAE